MPDPGHLLKLCRLGMPLCDRNWPDWIRPTVASTRRPYSPRWRGVRELRALVDFFRAHGLNAGTAFYQCVGFSLCAAAPKRQIRLFRKSSASIHQSDPVRAPDVIIKDGNVRGFRVWKKEALLT